jgi:ribulose 1,5-bisphosphate synthetase/thiazole synthase
MLQKAVTGVDEIEISKTVLCTLGGMLLSGKRAAELVASAVKRLAQRERWLL